MMGISHGFPGHVSNHGFPACRIFLSASCPPRHLFDSPACHFCLCKERSFHLRVYFVAPQWWRKLNFVPLLKLFYDIPVTKDSFFAFISCVCCVVTPYYSADMAFSYLKLGIYLGMEFMRNSIVATETKTRLRVGERAQRAGLFCMWEFQVWVLAPLEHHQGMALDHCDSWIILSTDTYAIANIE